MNWKRTLAAIGLMSCMPIASLSADADAPNGIAMQLENTQPERVLFVGNSYLYYNDSLHNHVRRIAAELQPDISDQLAYKSSTIGGAALSHHAMDSLLTPGKLGIDKPFEVVVLQGGSGEVLSEKRRAVFFEVASDYAKKIRRTGAEVSFYMTHAYVPPHRLANPDLIKTIAAAYLQVGRDNQALVIPVGLGFQLSYQRRPDLLLHEHFDGTHPNMYGTYLAACITYLSLYGGSLDDLEYDYYGEVPQEVAIYLRTIARDTTVQFSRIIAAQN